MGSREQRRERPALLWLRIAILAARIESYGPDFLEAVNEIPSTPDGVSFTVRPVCPQRTPRAAPDVEHARRASTGGHRRLPPSPRQRPHRDSCRSASFLPSAAPLHLHPVPPPRSRHGLHRRPRRGSGDLAPPPCVATALSGTAMAPWLSVAELRGGLCFAQDDASLGFALDDERIH